MIKPSMKLSYSFNKQTYSAAFTYNEDDRMRTYYVELNQPEQKKLLGDQVTIQFSKVKKEYELSSQSSPEARELQGSIAASIEQLERNRG